MSLAHTVRRAVLATMLVGCAAEEPPAPAPTFEGVLRVFDESGCAERGCHSDDEAEAGLTLTDESAWEQLVDAPCALPQADQAGMVRVRPGDPDDSFLMLKLTVRVVRPDVGLPMPPVGEPLDDDALDTVREWIDNGAPAP